MPGNQTTSLAWERLPDLTTTSGPLHARLAAGIREAVRSGRLPAGTALPASRAMAGLLGCSRWVVTEAYAQLAAEGYLSTRPGSATRVSATMAGPPAPDPVRAPTRWLMGDLSAGVPDIRAFPRTRWVEAVRVALREAAVTELVAPAAAGHIRLREALGAHLGRTRALEIAPADLTVTHGVADGLARLGRALAAAGVTHLAVEDPGWPRLRTATGLIPVPVAVDADGLRVSDLPAGVGAVLVTPDHQFPTGVVLSAARRAALSAWAASTGALIIENGYDTELRHDRPRPTDPAPTARLPAAPDPAPTARPGDTLRPAPTARPGAAPDPAPTTRPDDTLRPTPTARPGAAPDPAPTTRPGDTLRPTPTARPGAAPDPAPTTRPGDTLRPTPTARPGAAPDPAPTTRPGDTLRPTPTARPGAALDPAYTARLGTVSKTLSPGLGLGWLVTPPAWTARVAAANAGIPAPSVVDQLALLEFLERGWYDRHLRWARERFRHRRAALTGRLPGTMTSGAPVGLHFLLHLPAGATIADAADVVRAAAAREVVVADVARYCLDPANATPALVIGLGNLADNSIPEAANHLIAVLRG